jgi:hydrogenase maturation protease
MIPISNTDTQPRTARTLVLGMGNTLMRDDGVGIHAVRAFRTQCGASCAHVAVEETAVAGPGLTTLLSGYKEAIIVDALLTRDSRPGAIHVLDLADLDHTRNTVSPHSMNLATAVELGRRCELPMPHRIRIVAVEIADAVNVGETCTPAVQEAISKVVDILNDICIK